MVMIEKLEALKGWLVKRLTPMCDADPNALAKYVVALIKKDKTDEELKRLCVEQLEVFLQKETDVFVSDLFEVLKNKSYIDEPPETTSAQAIPGIGEQKELKKGVKRRLQRPSPIRHRSRSPYESRRRRRDDMRQRRSRSPRRGRGRRYRSHSGSPKKSRLSPKRKSPIRRSRTRSRSPYSRRRGRTRSLSSSRSSSRSPDSSHQKSASEAKKKRCWDYDQKGFCILGDKCPYDHGADPVVVDDSTISSSTTRPAAPVIVPITAPPPVQPPAAPKAVPPPIMPPFLPPPPIGFPPIAPPSLRPPIPPPMPPPPPGIRVPPPRMLPPPQTSQPPPGYNPEAPGLTYMQRRQNLTNLVPISAGGSPPTDGTVINRNRIVQFDSNTDEHNHLKRTIYSSSVVGTAPPSGPPSLMNNNSASNFSNNSKLVIRKIPPIMNNITKLNEHFSKFGAINNIQVRFENDAQCALVEYAHVNSARAAKRSEEAVFNNRFIVVHWYNPQQSNGKLPQSARMSVKDRLGTLPTPSQLKYTAPGKETKSVTQMEPVATGGTIFRTIANPSATVKPSPGGTVQPSTDNAEMKAKVLQAQKAAEEKRLARQKIVMQKRLELQQQKRELLQKQMQQQKLFLNKIKMTKNMPANEKLKLLESLKVLTASIDKLRTSLKGEDIKNPAEVKEKQKQTQKELLDAELDLYNASTTGENTMGLKRKLSQLKMEASTLGLVTGYRGSWGGPYRGRGRGVSQFVRRPKQPRVFSATANLDRRPRELRITGFQGDEKDEVISHLARFGEIENFVFNDDDVTCTVKFQTRSQAEQAACNGPIFKNRRIVITWNTAPGPSAQPLPTEAAESPANPGVTEELAESPEEALVVPPDDDKEEDDAEHDDDDDDDEVNVHIGDVTVNYPSELEEEEFDGEEELDEDALLAADYDEDDDHIGDVDDDYDEEIRSWRP